MDIIRILDNWEKVAWDNSKALLKKFGKGEAWELTNIWFGSDRVQLVYCLYCGQHVSDNFPIEEWLEFYDKHKRRCTQCDATIFHDHEPQVCIDCYI